MKLAALFACIACLTGAGTYVGATAGSEKAAHHTAAPTRKDSTPTAQQFAHAFVGVGGQRIGNVHCVKAAPAHYMCAYAVLKPSGQECHLMQALWTPDAASTITVTLAGQAGRCDSVRDAVQSLG